MEKIGENQFGELITILSEVVVSKLEQLEYDITEDDLFSIDHALYNGLCHYIKK